MTDGPHYANGKICYLEIPTMDIRVSEEFYVQVFGWSTRRRGDGSLAFDDSSHEVSGSWVTGRPPASEATMLIYIMVDDMEKAVESVIAHGGTMVQPIGMDAPEITARFKDPSGNLFGLYQQPVQTNRIK